MNFKKPKEQVISDAHMAADSTLYAAFANIKYGYNNSAPNNNLDQIQFAISDAIRNAVASIVRDTYTDEEFEEDMGLRDKA